MIRQVPQATAEQFDLYPASGALDESLVLNRTPAQTAASWYAQPMQL